MFVFAALLAPTIEAYENVFGLVALDGSAPGAFAEAFPAGIGRSAGKGRPIGDMPIAAPAPSAATADRRPLLVGVGVDPFVPFLPNMLDSPDDTGCFCCPDNAPPFVFGDDGANEPGEVGVGESTLASELPAPASVWCATFEAFLFFL